MDIVLGTAVFLAILFAFCLFLFLPPWKLKGEDLKHSLKTLFSLFVIMIVLVLMLYFEAKN